MAGPSIAPTTSARAGWRLLDRLLDELETLVDHDLTEAEFAGRLLESLAPLGFDAAAIWRLGSAGNPDAVKQASWGESKRLLPQISDADITACLQAAEPQWVTVQSERTLLAPWSGGNQRGVIQVLLAASSNDVGDEGYKKLLAAVGEIVSRFYTIHEPRQPVVSDFSQRMVAFAQSAHQSLDLSETAYRIVNDGRSLLGCERVALAVRRGTGFTLLAVSGAAHIHRRADTVRQLERLCAQVAATGQPLWHEGSGEELAPQIADALAEYFDVSPSLALAVIPLTEPISQPSAECAPDLPVIAMLVVEQYTQPFPVGVRERMEWLSGPARSALANSLQIHGIPGHRWLLAWGRRGRFGSWVQRAAAVGGALAALVILLFLTPADVKVTSRGELQPQVRHEVFAPRDCLATEVCVDHGRHVVVDEKLLELRSPDLDLELQRVHGELETTRKQLAAAQSERLQSRPGDSDHRQKQRRLTADEEQLQQRVTGLEKQQELLDQQRRALTVRSPVAGEVITWNAHEKLASRPLRRGDALLTIADENGPWQLELNVPSRRAGRLLAAWKKEAGGQPVSFVLTTNPGVKLHGVLRNVADRVEIDDSGTSSLRTIVDVDRESLPHRIPGATVAASITTGHGSLAEAWFYELFDTVQLWFQFGF